ncbi:MAG: TetR/AcrR family transcriptional regulator [Geothrix sp.]|nr:TetR/AcrR family transcriptional regulator [Geothrix sp.]
MIVSTRQTTAKRTEIADAALRIIGERGITALTMATLAAELGLSPGAPFRHFASRDEILEEVAHRVVELIGAAFPDPALPPLERLSHLFLARTEVLGRNTGCGRLIFSDQFAKALPENAAATIRGLVRQTRTYLVSILKEASEAGQIRNDLAPEDLLIPVIGTLQHLAFLASLPADGPPLRRPDPKRALNTLLTLLSLPEKHAN